MATFIETDCTIRHEGLKFTAGGAWMADCTDGYRRGAVYVRPNDPPHDGPRPYRSCLRPCRGTVTDWHGNKIADARFGAEYFGPFCKMRAVSFTVDGVRFTGRYCPDWSQLVRVRSTKRVQPAA